MQYGIPCKQPLKSIARMAKSSLDPVNKIHEGVLLAEAPYQILSAIVIFFLAIHSTKATSRECAAGPFDRLRGSHNNLIRTVRNCEVHQGKGLELAIMLPKMKSDRKPSLSSAHLNKVSWVSE